MLRYFLKQSGKQPRFVKQRLIDNIPLCVLPGFLFLLFCLPRVV
jgi:hypothetical protein